LQWVTLLQTLRLERDGIQRLPPISKLMWLQKLTIESLAIRELPATFGLWTALRKLKLNLCRCKELPASFGSLAGPQSLEIAECNLKDLPANFKDLTRLRKLKVWWCHGDESLDESLNRYCVCC